MEAVEAAVADHRLPGYLSCASARACSGSFFGVVKPVGVAGLVVLLLLAQPDFGSATLIIATTVGHDWLGGARMRNLFLLGAPLLPALAWAGADAGLPRQAPDLIPRSVGGSVQRRLPADAGLIAVGRGEWTGVGLGGSIQKLYYLPEAHSDFILAVIAEEPVCSASVLVLGLFAWLCGRGLQLGLRARCRSGPHFQGSVAFGISLVQSRCRHWCRWA